MSIQCHTIALADAPTTVWSGGTTTELFLYPKTGSYKDRTFEARISSATVDLAKSTYTSLPGVDRFLSPLERAFILSHPGTDLSTTHLKPFEVYAFSGDLPTECEGTGRDFNLMVRGGMKGTMVPITDTFTPTWPEGARDRILYLYHTGPSINLSLSTGQQLVLSPQTLLLVTLDASIETTDASPETTKSSIENTKSSIETTGPSIHLATSPLHPLLGGTIYRP